MLKADFIGVYSSQNQMSSLGSQVPKQKQLWFVWKTSKGEHICQPIDSAYNAKGDPRKLNNSVFDISFTLEPKIFAAPVRALDPSLLEVVATSKPAESLPEIHDELGISMAQMLDAQLREDFALQMQKLKRGKKNEAIQGIKEILERKQGIITAHKHLYTEIGIELRNIKLLDMALIAFERAYTLAKTDANTVFNLARIHYQLDKYAEAKDYIDKVLAIEPDHKPALSMKAYLSRQKPIIKI